MLNLFRLSHQMRMFNEAYAAVPLGEDIIKEYVMYTYDVPVIFSFVQILNYKYWWLKYRTSKFRTHSDTEHFNV